MTGQELYERYQQHCHGRIDCVVEDWDDLSEADQSTWNALGSEVHWMVPE